MIFFGRRGSRPLPCANATDGLPLAGLADALPKHLKDYFGFSAAPSAASAASSA